MNPTSSESVGASQTFGDQACHPERSEGSGSPDEEILRCAQDDSQDTSQVAFMVVRLLLG
ncbi:MAG TPA: hypothetical protein VFN02_08290 [Ktedonobacteraceae bacterium]|nr:hypothetical protein [Ktedonobacteraceae bacterium]